jgi:hypothetical protein
VKPQTQAASCSEIDDITDAIKGFLKGEEIEFSLDVVKLDLFSTFQQIVLRAEHRILERASVPISSSQGIWGKGETFFWFSI